MSLSSHLAELERKHQALDRKLAEEVAHPNQDTVKIAALKRQKLQLKDEINRLRDEPTGHSKSIH